MIGEGTIACIKRNYDSGHRGGKMFLPLPVEADFVKSKERIFVEPQKIVCFKDPDKLKSYFKKIEHAS